MNDTQKQIVSSISSHDTIIIHRHVNPDPDAIGAQIGLRDTLRVSFPEKSVYAVGEESEHLQFLARMDEVPDGVYSGALVIVLDTANTERISDQRFSMGSTLIKIDHHPDKEPYGDLSWVDIGFSSTSEMLAGWLLDYAPESMTPSSARLFYAGILGDTGRFLYSNTTPRTLRIASSLREYPFDQTKLTELLYRTSRSVAMMNGYVLQNYEVTPKGVAHMTITQHDMDRFGVSREEASNLVYTLSNIEGNHIWVFFVENGDSYRVRIRSKRKNVAGVASQYNGGGHHLACGASVSTLDERDELINDLDGLLS